jgi:acetolactate synthase-1/3 small subunit
MNMLRTFIVYVADHPGVLNRVSSLFRRRGYNIESLTVGHTHVPGISRMTAVVAIEEQGARLVEANLYKLAEVRHVEDITSVPSLHRELVIAKIAASADTRPEVMRVIDAFHARVLEVGTEWLVIEATGAEETIDSLLEGIRPYSILEMSRTGRVAMTRGKSPAFELPDSSSGAGSFWNQSESATTPRNCS